MPGAYYCLAVLTTINILNYTDRYIPSATKEFIIEEFNLSDAESGMLRAHTTLINRFICFRLPFGLHGDVPSLWYTVRLWCFS